MPDPYESDIKELIELVYIEGKTNIFLDKHQLPTARLQKNKTKYQLPTARL